MGKAFVNKAKYFKMYQIDENQKSYSSHLSNELNILSYKVQK